MNKIGLIIIREYLSRIKKKSFVIMTFLGPFLFALLFTLPAWFMSINDTDVKKIAVIDSSRIFIGKIPDTKYLKFEYLQPNTDVNLLKNNFDQLNYYAVLYIAHIITNTDNAVQLMSNKQPALSITMHISNAIEKELEKQKLATYNIQNLEHILKSIKTNIQIRTIKWNQNGNDKIGNAGLAMVISYFSGFLIYLFIFLFGAQVMRGVIEEKTSRIIEIIISSVKPFQLMMGKIIGIACVGLTQFIAWIILTFVIVSFIQHKMMPDVNEIVKQAQVKPQDLFASSSTFTTTQAIPNEKLNEIKDLFSNINNIDFLVMISSFVFFFIGGYLFYGSLFAAIGSMVDNESDTQQFMLPVTIPLVLAMFIMLHTINNPESPISLWFSLIPFTSPIVMMARIPYGIPYVEVILSASILIIGFIFTTWISSKIYKVGILMYGKKPNVKDIWKWLQYK